MECTTACKPEDDLGECWRLSARVTVFVYVNASKQIGDAEQVRVFCRLRRREDVVPGKRSRRRGVEYEALE
jgi:hypothetical protein